MKIMHKPIGVRSRIEELLEKEGKELINLAYGIRRTVMMSLFTTMKQTVLSTVRSALNMKMLLSKWGR